MLIDTHAHLNFKDFNKDRDEVIKRSLENNIWLINASSTFNTSKLAVEIAEKYPEGVYASVGLHPIHVRQEELDVEKYRELAKSEKVVAIGETGLDYMYPEHEKQEKVFFEHLVLAKELDLPVIFHCRKAHNEMLQILHRSDLCKTDRGLTYVRGVVHCFTGSWKQAKQYLDMGLYLGFNGIIYKMGLDEVIKKTPLDRMLIETDCPYLTPRAEGKGRNEPIFIKHIVQTIAEIRGEPFDQIAQATTQNAKKLFSI